MAKNNVEPRNEVGARMRARRKKRGLTLDQVGKFVGVTGSAVSQWETKE